ncbi:MAG: hypothetical protein BMS9Abin30_0404 [Gammaproteobacteria bacterium]|nr:MAG: hypothetical protein BMS9Abin30_0404 [Gammaproteobacteria bacterium]
MFLPGLGGTTRYWTSRIKPLEQDFRVVRADLLGFGESPKPWTKYSVERHVSALHRSLAPYQPFTLVGHSLGAVLALAYAARHPQGVNALVLIGMPYFSSQNEAYQYYRKGPARGGWLLTNSVLAMAACILTRRLFGKLLPYLLRHVPREVAEDLVKHTWRSSTSSLWEVIYRHDLEADIDSIPVSTVVHCIHGDRDEMAPLEPIRYCTSNRANWNLTIVPLADHHPFLRNTDLCLEVMRLAAA